MNTIRPVPFGSSVLTLIVRSLQKCNPFTLIHNPVIFITEIGAIVTAFEALYFSDASSSFSWSISLWLWLTVFFANMAETIAEMQNQSQAHAIKKARSSLMAHKLLPDGSLVLVPSHELKKEDLFLVKAGEWIPADGEIMQGTAAIDESSFTGESQPVIRTAGTDHNAVIAGTKVLSDELTVRVASHPGEGYLDKIVAIIEGGKRRKSKNEISLSLLLSSLTLIFLVVVISFQFFGLYYHIHFSITRQVAFLVCLIPTTIAGLLSAIGIAGIHHLLKKNVLTLNRQALEAAGDVDIFLIDKTGTLTYGNRMAYEFIPSVRVQEKEFHEACHLCCHGDQTPEGKSIFTFLKKKFPDSIRPIPTEAKIIPFSAYTRLSGIDIGTKLFRKGAVNAIEAFVKQKVPEDLAYSIQRICERGGTPLLVASSDKILGVIFLKDILKPGLSETFSAFPKMGIKALLVTGDNEITAKAIAGESDIDDFLAGLSPEEKRQYIEKKQTEGFVLGMAGDGINDALALAQADLGVAMHAGMQGAQESANMIDLDSNPSKLFEIVQIGKQMLMTRGALTTFSMAADVAKYFVVLPALLTARFPELGSLNLMQLSSPDNAIVSAVIFNALAILALIPLAFKGVKFVPSSSSHILNRNLLFYGIGGLLFPFVAIKIIDLLLITFREIP